MCQNISLTAEIVTALTSIGDVLRRRRLCPCPTSCVGLSPLTTHFVDVSLRASLLTLSTSRPLLSDAHTIAADALCFAGLPPIVDLR